MKGSEKQIKWATDCQQKLAAAITFLFTVKGPWQKIDWDLLQAKAVAEKKAWTWISMLGRSRWDGTQGGAIDIVLRAGIEMGMPIDQFKGLTTYIGQPSLAGAGATASARATRDLAHSYGF